MLICTFDDRASDLVGLKLLITSLRQFAPHVSLHLACPAADEDFERWLEDYPHVIFDRADRWRGKGWDVKPLLLRELLLQGHDEVMWIDSDVIVTGDFLSRLPSDDSVVVTEEPRLSAYGVAQRVRGWGLTQARQIAAINSCIVRVRKCHLGLLDAWLALMRQPDYQTARSQAFENRMPHVLGDQDVLVALLASTRYAGLKLHYLMAGRDIIQAYGAEGYPLLHRLRHVITGLPPLVHSQGHKPWRPPVGGLVRLQLETSAYAHYARTHRAAIHPFPPAMEIHSRAAHASRLLSFGHPALAGMSLALLAALAGQSQRISDLGRRAVGKLRGARTHASPAPVLSPRR